MRNALKQIIKNAIDIHVHIGPEVIPRKYTVESLINSGRGAIAGFVLKNHFYSTVPFVEEVEDKKGLSVFGSLALNNALGGLNSEAIYASKLLTDKPFFVWFPTINADNFLKQSDFEIPAEWVQRNDFVARRSNTIDPVIVSENNKLTYSAIDALKMIKKCNAILATGHISWKETKILVKKALELKIEGIVITHPIYQRIGMPVTEQIALGKKGCFLEVCYSMYKIDNISIKDIANQVKEIGSKYIIISSDVGQKFSLSPSKALEEFANLLNKEGISEKDLEIMMVTNPKKLLRIR